MFISYLLTTITATTTYYDASFRPRTDQVSRFAALSRADKTALGEIRKSDAVERPEFRHGKSRLYEKKYYSEDQMQTYYLYFIEKEGHSEIQRVFRASPVTAENQYKFWTDYITGLSFGEIGRRLGLKSDKVQEFSSTLEQGLATVNSSLDEAQSVANYYAQTAKNLKDIKSVLKHTDPKSIGYQLVINSLKALVDKLTDENVVRNINNKANSMFNSLESLTNDALSIFSVSSTLPEKALDKKLLHIIGATDDSEGYRTISKYLRKGVSLLNTLKEEEQTLQENEKECRDIIITEQKKKVKN